MQEKAPSSAWHTISVPTPPTHAMLTILTMLLGTGGTTAGQTTMTKATSTQAVKEA